MSSNTGTSDLRIYSRLLSYVVPYWMPFLISIVGFLIYSLANVSFVHLISFIVDSLGGESTGVDVKYTAWLSQLIGDTGDLNRTLIPLLIVIIAVTRGFGTFIGNYFISYVATYLVHNLRCQLFDRLLMLPSAFYDRHAMGHLVAKVTYHVTQVTGAATDAVRVIIREGFTVVFYLGYLLYLNWKLTLIFLAVAPVIALLVGYAGRRFRRISERIQNSMGDVTHVASETVQGYREVRTFGGTEYERDRFLKVSHDNRQQSMKMVVTSAISTPVIQVLVAVALACLVWLVLDPVLLSNMTAGNVIAFITTGGLLAKPIRQLSEVNATVQKGLAAAEDIFDLFDEDIEKDQGSFSTERVAGRVEFRNVTFSYGPGAPDVLNQVSFTVEPGETIALVGRSGSGKSTLVSLIPRFYSPSKGEILIDGTPIESFKLENLRKHIAIVSQQVTLFNDTVARNIGYGTLQQADVADIRRAAERAYAWNFIEALESGLDTMVGDDGVLLSGGQRQRLAIARAFLKDAPILILDEATSALDTESERYIQKALEAVVKGRTTFVIAHRLSTVEKADRILVIDQGQIVEQGSHQELMAKRGFYAQLHDKDEITADTAVDDETSAPLIHGNAYPVQARSASIIDRNLLVDAWYQEGSWVRWLAPFAYVFRAIADWRRRGIERKVSWKAPVPVFVVGNISVGGTGKSPLVIALANYCRSVGLRPGIVSRGYGGRSMNYPVAVSSGSSAQEVGDEPRMIHLRTGCPVVVDPDRVRAVQALLRQNECDLVISDDGLQHYAMNREVEIAVVDAERGLGNGLCLPAGPLREPVSRLAEVDLVVVNGERDPLAGVRTAKKIHMRLHPQRLVNVTTAEERPTGSFAGSIVHAVAGISHPDRFFDTLRQLGCSVIPHRFPDHHVFSPADLQFEDGLAVIMTEKDAVKLDHTLVATEGNPYWYLEVSADLPVEAMARLLQKVGLTAATTPENQKGAE